METELRQGYSGTARRRGRQQTNRTYCHRATSRLYRDEAKRSSSWPPQNRHSRRARRGNSELLTKDRFWPSRSGGRTAASGCLTAHTGQPGLNSRCAMYCRRSTVGGQNRQSTQTRLSGFSKAARRLDRPLQGSASTKQPFEGTWSRPLRALPNDRFRHPDQRLEVAVEHNWYRAGVFSQCACVSQRTDADQQMT